MPETPEQLYEQATDALLAPPVQNWDSWPFWHTNLDADAATLR
jgi:hypothetical protein